MRNTGVTQPARQGSRPGSQSRRPLQASFNLRTLRDCKATLYHGQNASSSRRMQGQPARGLSHYTASRSNPRIWLQQAAGQALSAARTCCDNGDLSRLDSNELAYLVHDFSKMLRPPVVQHISDLLELLAEELIARTAACRLQPVTIKELALLACGISKGEGPRARQALEPLAEIVMTMAPLRPEDGWTGQPLSMMANGLSKGTGDSSKAALSLLAQTLTQGGLSRKTDWNAQSLSMMANALIKRESEGVAVQAALNAIAQACIRWGLMDGPGYNAHSISMLGNALGKGDSDSLAIQQALNKLAQIIKDKDLAADPGWNAASFSMMANGLSKVSGPDITDALVQIARALLKLPGLTCQHGWTDLQLAIVGNGLVKALPHEHPADDQAGRFHQPGNRRRESPVPSDGAGEACLQAAVNKLAQTVLDRAINDSKNGWSVQHLVMMANALSKGTGPDIRPALAHLARALRARDLHIREQWTAQNLATLANAFGKIETDEDAQKALMQLAQAIKDRDIKAEAGGWAIQHLAMMSGGLGRGSGPDVEAALVRLAEAVKSREITVQQGWITKNLAMMANAFGKVAEHEHDVVQEVLTGLARAVLENKDWDLTPGRGWSLQDLVMLANGLSKGKGKTIRSALAQIARALGRYHLGSGRTLSIQQLVITTNAMEKAEEEGAVQQVLTQLAEVFLRCDQGPGAGWTPLGLSLMAHGLSKGRGPVVEQALTLAAEAVVAQDLGGKVLRPAAVRGEPREWEWTAHILAILANGLSKGRGDTVREALVHIACEVLRRREVVIKDWRAQHLVMVANGIGKVDSEKEVQEALECMAEAVRGRALTLEAGWHAQPLSIMASELAWCPTPAALDALSRIVRALEGRPLTLEAGWNAQSLSMMMEGAGQLLYGSPLFEDLAQALAARAGQAPDRVLSVLSALCRFALSAHHLRGAGHLMSALRAHNFQPRHRREKEILLWAATLFHFASLQQEPADPALTEIFDSCCRYYLTRPVAAGDEPEEEAEEEAKPPVEDKAQNLEQKGKTKNQGQEDKAKNQEQKDWLPYDQWHSSWACAYWRRLPGPCSQMGGNAVGCSGTTPSGRQRKVFEQLRRALPGHQLAMEWEIRNFAVDIVIDGRVCVEVDGPDHFVPVPATDENKANDAFFRKRRTKDNFIDHVLRQFGYLVFRIPADQNAERVRRLAGEIRAALAPVCDRVE